MTLVPPCAFSRSTRWDRQPSLSRITGLFAERVTVGLKISRRLRERTGLCTEASSQQHAHLVELLGLRERPKGIRGKTSQLPAHGSAFRHLYHADPLERKHDLSGNSEKGVSRDGRPVREGHRLRIEKRAGTFDLGRHERTVVQRLFWKGIRGRGASPSRRVRRVSATLLHVGETIDPWINIRGQART